MRSLVLCVCVLLGHASVDASPPQYTMLDLGPGRASQINDNRQIVGTTGASAFIWDSDNGMRALGSLAVGAATTAIDINNLGQVVGNSGSHAFIWDSVNGMHDLGSLGGDRSEAIAINDLGQVVGHSENGDGHFRPFLWDTANGIREFDPGFPEGSDRRVADINNKGQVLGYDQVLGTAYLWDPVTGFVDISGLNEGDPFGTPSAQSLNDTGQISGSCMVSRVTQHAFFWDKLAGLIDLGVLAVSGSIDVSGASDISNEGVVVGYSISLSQTWPPRDPIHAFIWDSANGMRDLTPEDFTISSEASGINSFGWVVGSISSYTQGSKAVLWAPLPPPTTPVVNDEGTRTGSMSQLAAEWSATDPLGVREYRYAIGTAEADPGLGYVVDWTSTGTTSSVTHVGLHLQAGQVYYFYVKARNPAGLWSSVGVSDGIMPVANLCESPGAAKLFSDGVTVGLDDVVVIAIVDPAVRAFYVEDPNRSSGVAVRASADIAALGVGDVVDLGGALSTIDGERVITGALVGRTGVQCALEPVVLSLSHALSGSFSFQTTTGAGQRGISDERAINLSTVGLLVQVGGRVMDVDTNFIYINDGTWPLYLTGARVERKNLPAAANPGDVVAVTGVSAMRKTGTLYQMLIRPRGLEDITVLQPDPD